MSLDPTAELNALRSRVSEIEQQKQKAISQAEAQWEKDYEEAVRIRKIAIERASSPDHKEKQKSRLQQTIQYYEKIKPQRIKSVAANYDKKLGQIKTDMTLLTGLTTRETPESKLDLALSYADRSKYAVQYAKSVTPDKSNKLIDSLSYGHPDQYAKGSDKNVWKNKLKYQIKGYGSAADFQKIREAEIQNRKQGMKQSAGLKAGGVQNNFNQGFTVSSKFMGYQTTGQAEIARQNKVNQIILNKQVEQANKNPIKHENKGSGTTTDPFRAQQPDPKLLSPYLKNNQTVTKIVDRYKVTTPDGQERFFKSEKNAQKFLNRIEGSYVTGSYVGFSPLGLSYQGPPKLNQEKVNVPVGSLEAIYGQPERITASTKSKGFFENLGVELYNSLRYYDRVESGEASKPKGLEYLPYYASKGLKPITDIPLNLAGKRTAPTLGSTAFDIGFQLVTKGKTETHDPIGDYVKKDPLGTLFEVPAEAALWISGTKATQAASKAVRLYSPIRYQKAVIAVPKGKYDVIYRGLTYKNNPVLGVQQGKLVTKLDYEKVPYAKISTQSREGFEASLGSGIEKNVFYSDKALSTQVKARVIPDIAQKRAKTAVSAVEQAQGITSKPGTLGAKPISGLTEKQSKDILAKVKTGQKSGDIDLIHGSAATRASVPESIKKQAGSSLILGDIDIIPKGGNLAVKADKLIQGFAKDFPLEKGQRIVIEGLGKGETTNRAIKLVENFKTGRTFYHGTDQEAANEILKKGFNFNKTTNQKTLFVGSNIDSSFHWQPAILRVELKPNAKILNLKGKYQFKSDEFQNLIKQRAKKEGYDAIENLKISGSENRLWRISKGQRPSSRELEILNEDSIATITQIKKGDKAYDEVIRIRSLAKNQNERLRNTSASLNSGDGSVWVNPKLKSTITKEPKKILEVVLRGSEESKYGIGKGDRILGYKIPFKKSQKVTDYGIKTTTADYQLLTNIKQVLAYQKGSKTSLDIYPSSGRTKDIVRAYWNLKGKAVYKGGQEGKQLDKTAEEFRKLYPGVEFTDYKPEKILLYSSRIPSKTPSSIQEKLTGSSILSKPPKPKTESKTEKTESSISSKTESIKPSVKVKKVSDSSGILSKYDSSRVIDSSRVSRPPSRIVMDSSRLIGSRRASIPLSEYSSLRLSRDYSAIKAEKPSIKAQSTFKNPPPSTIKSPQSKIKSPNQRPTTVRNPTLRTTTIRLNKTQKSFLDTKSRKPLGPFIAWKTGKSFGVPKPPKRRFNYRGNVREESVLGIYSKEKETTYNPRKILELTTKDRTKTKKDYSKNLLDFKESNRKSKSFLRL